MIEKKIILKQRKTNFRFHIFLFNKWWPGDSVVIISRGILHNYWQWQIVLAAINGQFRHQVNISELHVMLNNFQDFQNSFEELNKIDQFLSLMQMCPHASLLKDRVGVPTKFSSYALAIFSELWTHLWSPCSRDTKLWLRRAIVAIIALILDVHKQDHCPAYDRYRQNIDE